MLNDHCCVADKTRADMPYAMPYGTVSTAPSPAVEPHLSSCVNHEDLLLGSPMGPSAQPSGSMSIVGANGAAPPPTYHQLTTDPQQAPTSHYSTNGGSNGVNVPAPTPDSSQYYSSYCDRGECFDCFSSNLCPNLTMSNCPVRNDCIVIEHNNVIYELL